uniref:Uncharacterized protein n=1 Tax=Triticum urartu TaxID=4572 RepID=A0A8R7Q3P4_TRIUA
PDPLPNVKPAHDLLFLSKSQTTHHASPARTSTRFHGRRSTVPLPPSSPLPPPGRRGTSRGQKSIPTFLPYRRRSKTLNRGEQRAWVPSLPSSMQKERTQALSNPPSCLPALPRHLFPRAASQAPHLWPPHLSTCPAGPAAFQHSDSSSIHLHRTRPPRRTNCLAPTPPPPCRLHTAVRFRRIIYVI